MSDLITQPSGGSFASSTSWKRKVSLPSGSSSGHTLVFGASGRLSRLSSGKGISVAFAGMTSVLFEVPPKSSLAVAWPGTSGSPTIGSTSQRTVNSGCVAGEMWSAAPTFGESASSATMASGSKSIVISCSSPVLITSSFQAKPIIGISVSCGAGSERNCTGSPLLPRSDTIVKSVQVSLGVSCRNVTVDSASRTSFMVATPANSVAQSVSSLVWMVASAKPGTIESSAWSAGSTNGPTPVGSRIVSR